MQKQFVTIKELYRNKDMEININTKINITNLLYCARSFSILSPFLKFLIWLSLPPKVI